MTWKGREERSRFLQGGSTHALANERRLSSFKRERGTNARHLPATGDWADEMDDIPVARESPSPTPPTHLLIALSFLAVAKDPNALRRGDPGYFESLPNRESRGGYPAREEIPIPSRPPYTAYVGNLAFDAVEEDIEVFFQGMAVCRLEAGEEYSCADERRGRPSRSS